MTAGKLATRFAIVYVLLSLLMLAISWALMAYGGYSGSFGLAFVPVFVAALDGGQAWVKKTGERPTSEQSWKLAGVMTLVVAILSALQLVVLLGLDGVSAIPVPAAWLLAILAGVLLLTFLMARLFFGLGVNSMAKQLDSRR